MQRMKSIKKDGRNVLVYDDTNETQYERIKRLLKEYKE